MCDDCIVQMDTSLNRTQQRRDLKSSKIIELKISPITELRKGLL